ncbi:MAG: Hsp20/alpha crystallin family protein [Anaerolineales bacterium]|nr:Hsp20/alpha crystallin family protein [Anaerolineales bacterium]
MAETKIIETQKDELAPDSTERTRECPCFVPRADIYELEDKLVIVTDVPGVNESSVDITLEKNILTINAYIEMDDLQGYSAAYAEYETGDYQRSFRLSEEVDQANIQAEIKNGVLRVYLPKAPEAQARKISVRAG